MWVKHAVDGYVNLDHIITISPEDSGSSVWLLQAYFSDTSKIALAGSWSSQAAAAEALRELVDGVDSATYGD